MPAPSLPLTGEGRGGGWPSGIRPYVLLCLLCLILYAPGLAAIPPLDRDEARFAQATRQMLETGDFVRIRFQDEARNKKPIGIYWLQAAAVAAFSSPGSAAIWPYRLPSALAATAAVLLTFGFGARLFGSRPAGFIAAVLTASALGVVVEAHLAKTDAALLAAVVAGQGALGLVYTRGPHRPPGRLAASASLLAGRSRRDPTEGAARPGAGAVDGGLPIDRGPRHPLDQRVAAACRCVDHGGDSGPVADRSAKRHRRPFHLGLRWRTIFCRSWSAPRNRTARRPAITWRW